MKKLIFLLLSPLILYGQGRTHSDDPLLEISRGNIDGLSVVNKFGGNTSIADGTTEEVWDGSVAYPYDELTTANITHVSMKADQVAMRSGTIEIQGLDTNWDLVVQTQDLDASNTTTAVALTTALKRVFRLKVLENVVTDQNVTVHNASDTTDFAIITAGNNQTLMALYTVPDGYTVYITQYYYDYVRDAVKDPNGINFQLWVADRDNSYEFQLKHQKGVPKQTAPSLHAFKPYFKVNGKSDIKITATPEGANASVHAGFDIILVRD